VRQSNFFLDNAAKSDSRHRCHCIEECP